MNSSPVTGKPPLPADAWLEQHPEDRQVFDTWNRYFFRQPKYFQEFWKQQRQVQTISPKDRVEAVYKALFTEAKAKNIDVPALQPEAVENFFSKFPDFLIQMNECLDPWVREHPEGEAFLQKWDDYFLKQVPFLQWHWNHQREVNKSPQDRVRSVYNAVIKESRDRNIEVSEIQSKTDEEFFSKLPGFLVQIKDRQDPWIQEHPEDSLFFDKWNKFFAEQSGPLQDHWNRQKGDGKISPQERVRAIYKGVIEGAKDKSIVVAELQFKTDQEFLDKLPGFFMRMKDSWLREHPEDAPFFDEWNKFFSEQSKYLQWHWNQKKGVETVSPQDRVRAVYNSVTQEAMGKNIKVPDLDFTTDKEFFDKLPAFLMQMKDCQDSWLRDNPADVPFFQKWDGYFSQQSPFLQWYWARQKDIGDISPQERVRAAYKEVVEDSKARNIKVPEFQFKTDEEFFGKLRGFLVQIKDLQDPWIQEHPENGSFFNKWNKFFSGQPEFLQAHWGRQKVIGNKSPQDRVGAVYDAVIAGVKAKVVGIDSKTDEEFFDKLPGFFKRMLDPWFLNHPEDAPFFDKWHKFFSEQSRFLQYYWNKQNDSARDLKNISPQERVYAAYKEIVEEGGYRSAMPIRVKTKIDQEFFNKLPRLLIEINDLQDPWVQENPEDGSFLKEWYNFFSNKSDFLGYHGYLVKSVGNISPQERVRNVYRAISGATGNQLHNENEDGFFDELSHFLTWNNDVLKAKGAAAFFGKTKGRFDPKKSQEITVLDLSGLALDYLPSAEVTSLPFPNLKVVNLSNNTLRFLPSADSFFSNAGFLESVLLCGNKLKSLPIGLGNHKWPQLRVFDVSDNAIQDLNGLRSISAKSWITSVGIILEDNPIAYRALGKIKERLEKQGLVPPYDGITGWIRHLSVHFDELGKITFLDLSGLDLDYLPSQFTSLPFKGLVRLDLSKNRLLFLPPSNLFFPQAKGLKFILLNNNELRCLPENFGTEWTQLMYFDAHRNKFQTLSNFGTTWPLLNSVSFAENSITEIAPDWGSMWKVCKNVFLEENPFIQDSDRFKGLKSSLRTRFPRSTITYGSEDESKKP